MFTHQHKTRATKSYTGKTTAAEPEARRPSKDRPDRKADPIKRQPPREKDSPARYHKLRKSSNDEAPTIYAHGRPHADPGKAEAHEGPAENPFP